MNLVEYRRRWPHLDVRFYMKRRVVGNVPRDPEPPHVRRAMKAWGRRMGKAFTQPRRKVAAILNEREAIPHFTRSCHCEKAEQHLAAHGWFVSVYSNRWSHDPNRVAVGDGYVTEAQRRHYRQCTECNDLFRGAGVVTTDLQVRFCSDACATEAGCTQRNGRWYSEGTEGECEWDSPSYYDDDDDDYDAINGVYSYCTYLGSLVGSGGKYQIGTELEIEFRCKSDKREFVEDITANFPTTEAHCKNDGSLSSYGVEVVTGYGAWQDMSRTATKVCELALAHDGKSHLTDSCGQHISIARSDMSCEQQAKFVVFFNLPDNQEILREFARRGQCTWARIHPAKADDGFIRKSVTDCRVPRGEKYEAVNCNHDTHLEVRIFKGSLRAATVIARMALVHIVAVYCEKSLTAADLKMPRFLEWLASQDGPEATSVKEYLVYRNQSLPAPVSV